MGRHTDAMIEEMQEEREDLLAALDDIEAHGEEFECPDEHCNERVCSKSCFVRHCFDWCLTHNHPSVEERDGTAPVTMHFITKDENGHDVTQTEVEERRLCGSERAQEHPGDCHVVVSSLNDDDDEESGVVCTADNQLWQLEHERYMEEVMSRDSP